MPESRDTSHDLIARSLSDRELPDPRASLSLLARAQAGDRSALEELVSRYHTRLRRIVRIQLGASSVSKHFDSIDIVQDTFRAALPRIDELRPHSAASLLQWFAMIATNQIRDAHDYLHAAKRDVQRGRPFETDEVRAARPDPAEHASLREVRDLLDAEVSRLPDDQRRVVVLRDYCGESWSRVAQDLNRGSGAARQLHQRAWIRLRAALRPILEAHGKPPTHEP